MESPRPRAESGQTTVEWLGIAAVAAAVIVVLISAAPGMGDSIAERFECLIDAVSWGGTGSEQTGCGGAEVADDNQAGEGQNGQDDDEALTPLEEATRGDYIAIGDSFSSGEGADDYGESDCHRSANGYPSVVADSYDFGGDVVNVTCSGATIDNVNGRQGQHGEDPQIGAITDNASLITVGIGGNDTGWTEVITSCATGGQMGGDICSDSEAVRAQMDAAVAEYDALLKEIMAGGQDARVIAIGYPRFFPDPPEEEWTYLCTPFGCAASISIEEQAWMNDMFREYNDKLRDTAEANGAEFVDTYDAMSGCELTTSDACMNGLMVDTAFEWPPAEANPGSFHPNAAGQQRLADLIQQQIEDP